MQRSSQDVYLCLIQKDLDGREEQPRDFEVNGCRIWSHERVMVT